MAYVNGNKVLGVIRTEYVGTPVEANPSEQATQTLEKLKVDDIVYEIPQGDEVHLYNHSILITNSSSTNYASFRFNIITPLSRQIARIEDLSNLFYNIHSEDAGIPATLNASGIITNQSRKNNVTNINLFVTQGEMRVEYNYLDINFTSYEYGLYNGGVNITSSEGYTLTDIVTQIF